MAKKVFDIIPPRLMGKVETKVKKALGFSKGKRKTRKAKKFSLVWTIISICVLFLIAIGVFLYFSLASAKVEIWPKTETITFKDQILAKIDTAAISLTDKTIPALVITEEKELWQEFPATGSDEKGGKAKGIIRVYNKYTPSTPISLKTGTHFLSDSGKYFITDTKISIPAAKVSGGKVTPGYIDVAVTAEEAGDQYNISSSKFSVPKLAGSTYYYSIYAESLNAMTGGFASDVKIITTDDIANAKDATTKKLYEDLEAALREKVPAGYILLENGTDKEILEAVSLLKAGSEVDKFNYKAKAKITAVIFKESDLKDFAEQYTLSLTSKPQQILQSSFDLTYSPLSVDVAKGQVKIELDSTAKLFVIMDTDALVESFRGKTSSEISNIISSQFANDITSSKVEFWPFWVKKAPKDSGHIKLELKFE